MVLFNQDKEDTEIEILRKTILKRLNYLKKRKFNEKALNSFNLALNVFLMQHFNIEYEFTEQELAKELNKIRIKKILKDRLINLYNLLFEIKYTERETNRDEFKCMITEAEKLINLTTIGRETEIVKEKKEKQEGIRTEEEVKPKHSIFDNFFRKSKDHKFKEKKLKAKKEEEKKIKYKQKKEQRKRAEEALAKIKKEQEKKLKAEKEKKRIEKIKKKQAKKR